MLTLQDLQNQYNNGMTFTFLPFFGSKEHSNQITNACLSQWYPCSFVDKQGVRYSSCEQYMMAQKALLFCDSNTYTKIMKTTSPKEVKALGRQVKNFDDAKWTLERTKIVVQGNFLKFSQNPKLCDFLINTQNMVLVEASPYDDIWGVKLSKDDTKIQNPNLWNGKNLLGFCLMEVREMLNQK